MAERLAPPRTPDQSPPPAVLVEHVGGRRLNRSEQASSTQAIHWPFGIALGALYGLLAEYYPQVTDRGGADFGVVLWTLAHEVALPMLRLTPPVSRMSVYEQGNELTTHAIYGVVTEAVRKSVRNALG